MAVLIDIAAKIAVGTAVFGLYRYWARRSQHSHAGMMLTFPALNGLGLALTGDAGICAKAAAMLPMIGINGGLCFAAVALAPAVGQLSKLAACGVATGAMLIWIGAAILIPPLEPVWNIPLVLAFGAGGWLWARRTWPVAASPKPSALRPWWTDKWLWSFSVTLALLLAAAEYWGSYHEAIGKLSALPLLPLFGLVSQMTKGPGAVQKFEGTVLFGPALAMMFVIAVTFFIQHDVLQHALDIPHVVLAMLYVTLGWLLCVKAIEAIARRAERSH